MYSDSFISVFSLMSMEAMLLLFVVCYNTSQNRRKHVIFVEGRKKADRLIENKCQSKDIPSFYGITTQQSYVLLENIPRNYICSQPTRFILFRVLSHLMPAKSDEILHERSIWIRNSKSFEFVCLNP
uniref:Secreted protein n=1 Tax=Heterorhabditis bacteriophora TaxID=37862 RepID=A0A1I7W988_HETBA